MMTVSGTTLPAWKALLREPRLWITVGTCLLFYILVRNLEGAKFTYYPFQSMMPQTALIISILVFCAVAWWCGSKPWCTYLMVHVFALGFASANLCLWQSTEFGPMGVTGDSWFTTTIVTKYTRHWDNTDFVYKGLHTFYPSLYHYIVGKLAGLTGTLPWKAVKYGGYWTFLLLTLAVYGSWRKVLTAMPALLLTAIFMSVVRHDLFFKPFEMISLSLFLPWLLYYIGGIRLVRNDEGKFQWESRSLTRREAIWAGVIGGLLFMTFYYYFFLLVVLLPVLILLDLRLLGSFAKVWAKYKPLFLVFGIMALVAAIYWVPLLLDMLRYGSQSLQNRWFSPHMLQLPFEGTGNWHWVLGIAALLLLAPSSPLARILLAVALSIVGYVLVGHLAMYGNLPLLHFRMIALGELVAEAGLVLGVFALLNKFGPHLNAATERLLPTGLMTFYCLTMAMAFMYSKEGNENRVARETELPGLAWFKEFDTLSKDKVFLTNRVALATFKPIYQFVCHNAHFSHPAGRFRERLKFLQLLSRSQNPDFVAWMLHHNRFDRVDYVLLDSNTLFLYDDNFPAPRAHIDVPIRFPDSTFQGQYFSQNPNFRELQKAEAVPIELWQSFSRGEQNLAALFASEEVAGLRAAVNADTLAAMEADVKIRTWDYGVWGRVFWWRYLGK